jgi:3',5'-cyclic AMP phosphodiesterase CpdA
MKLYAISDIHISHEINRKALEALPEYKDDWLIVAGDIGETVEQTRYALDLLNERFAQLLWVPGNHDLWTNSNANNEDDRLRGEAKYRKLVEVCREQGVLTPEDPYVMWEGEGPAAMLVPMFLLYDYSFRPATISRGEAVVWAEEQHSVCSDEYLLHPDPYPTRDDWCAALCTATEKRLQEIDPEIPLVLINHWPLREFFTRRLRYIPRFSLWCGTRITENWHRRFHALTVVYGHLHIPVTDVQDGVRFEEVSLGYPKQWDQKKGMQHYLRQILPGPQYTQRLTFPILYR